MKIFIIIMACVASGCVSMGYDEIYSQVTITPTMDPDGTKTFSVIGLNRLPSYATNLTPENYHARMIQMEMGKQNYCPDGYSINPASTERSKDVTIYHGTCK